MKKNYLMRIIGILTYVSFAFIVLGAIFVFIIPGLTIHFFVIGGLLYLITAVLHIKSGVIDTWSYIAAFSAFLTAFYLYSKM